MIDGKKNPVFSLIANILGVLSEQERENLRERQMEGIQIAKLKGVLKDEPMVQSKLLMSFLKSISLLLKI